MIVDVWLEYKYSKFAKNDPSTDVIAVDHDLLFFADSAVSRTLLCNCNGSHSCSFPNYQVILHFQAPTTLFEYYLES